MTQACNTFEPWIRVIRAFNTKGIEQKHIDKLNSAIDKANDSEDSLNTLSLKMDVPIMSLGGVKITPAIVDLEDIADTASKEYGNICLLKTMKADWKPLNFDVKDHKDTYILEGEAC
jgi:phosphoribosylformimino-5-aminoimidazole carboxamide ribonucleotide (ProFAR) isomerase